MELRRYLEIVSRRKWIVIIITAVVIEVVIVGSSLMTPIYSASTLLRVATFTDSTIEYFPMDYSDRLMNTNIQLLKSRPFLEEVISRLSLETSPGELKNQILVEAVPNTELLRISTEATDPIMAADIATTLGDLLIEQREGLFSGTGRSALESLAEQLTIIEADLSENRSRLQDLLGDTSGINQSESIEELSTRIQIQEETYSLLLNEYDRARVTEGLRANSIAVVEPAIPPLDPSKPDIFLNSILGGVLGLIGGIALVFLLDNLDTSIHTVEDLESSVRAPVLGLIPKFPASTKSMGGDLISASQARSPASEAFRVLRTNFLSIKHALLPKFLLITSAEPDSGKSTVVANLAVSIAQGGHKVLVVDGDLGRPSMHKLFRLSNEYGLSSVLRTQNVLDDVIQETSIDGLSVLTTGLLPSDPGDLLEATRLKSLIADLSDKADFILIDSPPILAVADAAVLAPLVEGVLIVATKQKASKKDLKTAVHQLALVGANVIGAVLNKYDRRRESYYFSEYVPSSQKMNPIKRLFRRRNRA